MERKYKITAETGLHARPATILVNEAVKFDAELSLQVDDKEVNMKSIMGVMSLGVYAGETITIRADGEDATEALESINKLILSHKLGKEL